MSGAKHAPGPWYVERVESRKTKTRIYVSSPSAETVVAEICGIGVRKDWRANASLIAAAPDMLEALEEIMIQVKMFKSICEDNGLPHVQTRGEALAEAVIKKARGE